MQAIFFQKFYPLLCVILYISITSAQKRYQPTLQKTPTPTARPTNTPFVASIVSQYVSSTVPVTIPHVTTMSIPLSQTYTPSPTPSEDSQCKVVVTSPRKGDQYAPGDQMHVRWDLIGTACHVQNGTVIPPYQVEGLLFANLTRNGTDQEWQWDYRSTLYQNDSTNITSFDYPIQIILSPGIRNLSLFYLDIELSFSTDPPGSIFDVVGPFTILPIPPPPAKSDDNSTDLGSEFGDKDLQNSNDNARHGATGVSAENANHHDGKLQSGTNKAEDTKRNHWFVWTLISGAIVSAVIGLA